MSCPISALGFLIILHSSSGSFPGCHTLHSNTRPFQNSFFHLAINKSSSSTSFHSTAVHFFLFLWMYNILQYGQIYFNSATEGYLGFCQRVHLLWERKCWSHLGKYLVWSLLSTVWVALKLAFQTATQCVFRRQQMRAVFLYHCEHSAFSVLVKVVILPREVAHQCFHLQFVNDLWTLRCFANFHEVSAFSSKASA